MFDYVFSNLPIGANQNRFAFQEVYGTIGWSLDSAISYTVDSGFDIVPNTPGSGNVYRFANPNFLQIVQQNLVDPGDRDYACNIIIVIWDGDAALTVPDVAAGSR